MAVSQLSVKIIDARLGSSSAKLYERDAETVSILLDPSWKQYLQETDDLCKAVVHEATMKGIADAVTHIAYKIPGCGCPCQPKKINEEDVPLYRCNHPIDGAIPLCHILADLSLTDAEYSWLIMSI